MKCAFPDNISVHFLSVTLEHCSVSYTTSPEPIHAAYTCTCMSEYIIYSTYFILYMHTCGTYVELFQEGQAVHVCLFTRRHS